MWNYTWNDVTLNKVSEYYQKDRNHTRFECDFTSSPLVSSAFFQAGSSTAALAQSKSLLNGLGSDFANSAQAGQKVKNTLETSGKDVKNKLETSVKDVKTTL